MPTPQPSIGDALSLRAILCALPIGLVICCLNIYFGLQANFISAMPLQSTLISYAIFYCFRTRLRTPFNAMENTVIAAIAGSMGLGAFTAGFTGYVPALQFLAKPEEGRWEELSTIQLLLWATSISSLGIVLAAPLRQYFILQQNLRFPSATATGALNGVLFSDQTIVARVNSQYVPIDASPSSILVSLPHETGEVDVSTSGVADCDRPRHGLNHLSISEALRPLLYSLCTSVSLSILSSTVPGFRGIPIFGTNLATDWLWTVDLAPAYCGYGMILEPATNFQSLAGAIIGWGILSPIAKHNGWAPGSVRDWENGSRGWIMWVATGLVLGETAVGLGIIVLRALPSSTRSLIRLFSIFRHRLTPERSPLITSSAEESPPTAMETEGLTPDGWNQSSLVTRSHVLKVGCTLVLFFLLVIYTAFGDVMPVGTSIVAIVLLPFASFISMQSLGETDYGASFAIGRAAQSILGLFVPIGTPTYLPTTVLLGGMVEGSSFQAAQQMGDLKTAFMTGAPPRAVFYAQMIGSFLGALSATLLYKWLISIVTIPSDDFEVPEARMWIIASRLFSGAGLPPKAIHMAGSASAIGGIFSILRKKGQRKAWHSLVPSGVALATGMYVTPSITIARAIGSLADILCRTHLGFSQTHMMCIATGLILGQGIVSILSLILRLTPAL